MAKYIRFEFLQEVDVLLSELLAEAPGILVRPSADFEISGITDDSRQVRRGMVFVAAPGETADGHRFIGKALEAGAVAVVGCRDAAELELPDGVPYVQVQDSRQVLGWMHAAWHGYPSRRMILAGVTGTDGKTTTTNLLFSIFQAAGFKAGMISTVNAEIAGQRYDTGLHTTTPVAADIQAFLARMVAAGTTHAILESTSHGLAQGRLAGCDFDLAIVTNVTHEHLDYHGSWEAYRDAKAMLFQGLMGSYRKPGTPKISVLNADDPGSYETYRAVPVDMQVHYGLGEGPEVTAREIVYSPQGVSFKLVSPAGVVEIRSPLVGAYNISNILAAASAALALDVPLEVVAQGVAAVVGVPGRMERIVVGQEFTAIVDFAHTPNALRRALETARQIAAPGGRVITVFGCAGLRDREKRRMMGEMAAKLADITVITAEDPRTESLDAIIDETATALLAAGRVEGRDFLREPDRGQALFRAVSLARAGDVVIACGKGHEQSMCFGTQEYAWDDRDAMRQALLGAPLKTLPTAV